MGDLEITLTLTGDWQRAMRIMTAHEASIKVGLDKALRAEAKLIKKGMVGNIDRGLLPDSKATQFIRRAQGGAGRKPLNATGLMRKQIVVTKLGPRRYFIGILNSAAGGRARIAGIQQAGANIRVTAKMRRFLHAMLRKGGAPKPPSNVAVVTIRIPPRPFIDPIVAHYERNPEPIKERIRQRVIKELFTPKAPATPRPGRKLRVSLAQED